VKKGIQVHSHAVITNLDLTARSTDSPKRNRDYCGISVIRVLDELGHGHDIITDKFGAD
jgi:hypothetical protein